jgi:hypothetical protein
MQADVEETRHEIHELIERLPETELQAALRMMQFLFLNPTCLAPLDDEPVSEQEEAAIRASEESIRRGDLLIPHEEILKEYGL